MAGDLRTNRNELIILFNTAWAALPGDLGLPFGPFPSVLTMTDQDGVPVNPGRLPWARYQIQHTGSQTRGIGGRRSVNSGLLTAQLFVYRDRTSADNQVQLMADYLVQAFRAYRGDITITDVGLQERPINNGFAQCDARASFNWQQYTRG